MVSAATLANGNRDVDLVEQEPISILHLLSSRGLYGAEQVVLNVAQSKNTVSYVGALYSGHGPALDVIQHAKMRGLRTVVFTTDGRLGIDSIFQIKSFLKKNRIDILHTHGYKSDVVGFLAALSGKTKWMATNHVWHPISTKLRVYESVDAFVLRFAKQVVAVSGQVKQDLISARVPPSKVCVIRNGVDIAQFTRSRSTTKAVRAELGLRDDDFVVTIVGRLSPEKGHRIFLHAAKRLSSSNRRNVKFLIVGDGPTRDELRAEALLLNLAERVTFTGFRRDMPEIYALSDVMVNTSSIEGLPMTLLEAMASGVPVVAARTGGIPEIIRDDETGLLISPNDIEGLTARVEALIDDPAKRQRIAAAAFQYVTLNHSREHMCERYRQVYGQVVGEQ